MTSKQSDLIVALLNFRLTTQIFHWQTASYATHKTTDDLLSSLQDKTDELAEVFQGLVQRRLRFSPNRHIFRYPNVTERSYLKNIRSIETRLSKIDKLLHGYPPSIIGSVLNIRDEILNLLHRTRYLLTFH